MPRVCTVCRHPAKDDINAAVVEGTDSFRTLAARFGLSATALKRHKGTHLPLTLVKAVQEAEVVQGARLLDQAEFPQQKTPSILARAEAAGNFVALLAIRKGRANAELIERCLERQQEENSLDRRLQEAVGRGRAQCEEIRQRGTLELLKSAEKCNQMREATQVLIAFYSQQQSLRQALEPGDNDARLRHLSLRQLWL